MSNQKQEVLDLQDQKQSLTQLSPFEVRVATLVQETQDLSIQGVEDREGIKRVHEARIELKSTRVEIDKTRKDLIAPALDWQKTVNAKAKELTEQIQPIEKRLQEEEDRIKEEKRRIKEQKERERMILIQERGSFIINNGGTFDGITYIPGLAYEVEITVDELFEIIPEKWEELKEEVLAFQAKRKEEERRIKITEAFDRYIHHLGYERDDERQGFVFGSAFITFDQYQEALGECFECNWTGPDQILPDELHNIYELANQSRLQEQEKRRQELAELQELQKIQAKKEAELKAKEAEIAKKEEAQKMEPVEQVLDEPINRPEIPPQTQKAQDPLMDQVRDLCEKILAKPFLAAQLPEAKSILETLNA